MKIQNNFMDIALKQAQIAYKKKEVPVGAIIERNGVIIAKAHNLRHTKRVSTFHAELIAIEKACKKLKKWQLDDCNLYVTLEPCLMCAGAIINARIKNVYYGAVDSVNGAYTVYNLSNAKNAYKVNTKFEENNACSELLSQFFKELRSK